MVQHGIPLSHFPFQNTERRIQQPNAVIRRHIYVYPGMLILFLAPSSKEPRCESFIESLDPFV